LCGTCFCEGKEIGRHKRWHDYRVVVRSLSSAHPSLSPAAQEQHAYPIFVEDWGADECVAFCVLRSEPEIRPHRELLLIDACQTYGLGNWADIADHIGSYRTKEEVEAHYLSTYVASPTYPLPRVDPKMDTDQEAFQARKKIRLETMQATKPRASEGVLLALSS
jgi:transcriptional adapter 2-alpha